MRRSAVQGARGAQHAVDAPRSHNFAHRAPRCAVIFAHSRGHLGHEKKGNSPLTGPRRANLPCYSRP
eukprot:101007-Pyramimonas_sp.AAC.1